MQVQLIIANKSQRGQIIPIDVPEFRIGRAGDCHFRSDSSWVSQQHCIVKSNNDTVTIQDSSGKKGTFVNGERISFSQELQDGDKIKIGGHSFIVSIIADTEQPEAVIMPSNMKSGQAFDAVFEIRRDHRRVSLTKSQLFELARKGELLPDDVVTVDGTKVWADTIQGIVFGNESSTDVSPTASGIRQPEQFESYTSEKNRNGTSFDMTNESIVQVTHVSGARRRSACSNYGESLEVPLVAKRHVAIASSVFATLCLLGVLIYFVIPGHHQKSLYGAVRITGNLKMDGKPIGGAIVYLYPVDKTGTGARAHGRTDKQGTFVVTTGRDSVGRGAVPGEYRVTFHKSGVIPTEYGNTETSGQFLVVGASGNNTFEFNLVSEAVATPPRPQPVLTPSAPPSLAPSLPTSAQGANEREQQQLAQVARI